jgi:hypothetical protein
MEEQKIKDCIKDLRKFKDAIDPLFGSIPIGGSSIQTALEELLYNFNNCLFKVDDKVKLTITPTIDNYTNWGWLAHKHFLIEGAKAKIHSRGIHLGKFRYGIIFDDESYIDYNTKEPVFITLDKRSIFTIPEDWLTKVEL